MIDPTQGSGVQGWEALGLWAAGLLFGWVMERLRKWAQGRDERRRRLQEAEDRRALFEEWRLMRGPRQEEDE